MAKNTDWREDSEAMAIAIKLTEKFQDLFEEIDLTKIKFIRNMGGRDKKVGEIKTCGFPYDTDSPYSYYIIINNNSWGNLTDAQQTLAVMHFLYSVSPGGTDEASGNYAKLRKHDVKDYNVVLAAAGGRYDWLEPGTIDIKNPLDDDYLIPGGPGEDIEEATEEEGGF